MLARSHPFFNVLRTLGDITDITDGDAAVFICEILHGNTPSELDSAVESEVAALTSFVKSLPTQAPQILSRIEQGGDMATSIVGELVTNPGAALTKFGSGVKSVFSDLTSNVVSVFSDVTSFLGGIGDDSPSSTTVNEILASCKTVMDQYSTTATRTTATRTTDQDTTTMATPTQMTASTIQYSATATRTADQNTEATAIRTQTSASTSLTTPGTGAASSQGSQTVASTSFTGASSNGDSRSSTGAGNAGSSESNSRSVGNTLSAISRFNCLASVAIGLGLGFVLLL